MKVQQPYNSKCFACLVTSKDFLINDDFSFQLKLCKKEKEIRRTYSEYWEFERMILFDFDSWCLYFRVNQIFVKVNSDKQNITKISQSLFLKKILQTLMFTEKCSNESRKSLIGQLLLEVSLFRFILFLHFSTQNVIITNIQ